MPEETRELPAVYESRYTARKAWFKLFGSAFRLFGPDGILRFYVKQRAFRLREELTVFADEQQTRPMLRIRARQVLDISATYDVTDANTGEVAGALRRAGMRSILRDEWTVLGPGDATVGKLQEDSAAMALLRRFLSNLIPLKYTLTMNGEEVGYIHQHWNPFLLRYDVDLSAAAGRLDPRLGVAIPVLLLAIEGRQG